MHKPKVEALVTMPEVTGENIMAQTSCCEEVFFPLNYSSIVPTSNIHFRVGRRHSFEGQPKIYTVVLVSYPNFGFDKRLQFNYSVRCCLC